MQTPDILIPPYGDLFPAGTDKSSIMADDKAVAILADHIRRSVSAGVTIVGPYGFHARKHLQRDDQASFDQEMKGQWGVVVDAAKDYPNTIKIHWVGPYGEDCYEFDPNVDGETYADFHGSQLVIAQELEPSFSMIETIASGKEAVAAAEKAKKLGLRELVVSFVLAPWNINEPHKNQGLLLSGEDPAEVTRALEKICSDHFRVRVSFNCSALPQIKMAVKKITQDPSLNGMIAGFYPNTSNVFPKDIETGAHEGDGRDGIDHPVQARILQEITRAENEHVFHGHCCGGTVKDATRLSAISSAWLCV